MSASGSYTPPPTPPPPPPSPSGAAPSSGDRTLMLVLAYLGILALVPFFAKKDDPEIQWHAKNGVALFGAEVAWIILEIMLMFVRIPFLGCGMGMIGCIVWLGFIALSVFCIMKAIQGQRFRIPVITDIAEKL